jgi:serine phosphatase RsbU (regulator of sigma subunit)
MKKVLISLLFVFISNLSCFAQEQDSIGKVLAKAKTPDERLNIWYDYIEILFQKLQRETIIKLAPRIEKDITGARNRSKIYHVYHRVFNQVMIHPDNPVEVSKAGLKKIGELHRQYPNDTTVIHEYHFAHYRYAYEIKKDYVEAEKYALINLNMAYERDAKELVFSTFYWLRWLYLKYPQSSQAEPQYLKLIRYFTKNKNPLAVGKIEIQLANLYKNRNRMDMYEKYIVQGLNRVDRAQKDGFDKNEYLEAANVFREHGNHPMALRFNRKVLAQLYEDEKKAGHPLKRKPTGASMVHFIDISQVIINMAGSFEELKQYDSLLACAKQINVVLKYAEEPNLLLRRNGSYRNAYELLEQYPKVIPYALANLEVVKGMAKSDSQGVFNNASALMMAYSKIGKYDSATYYYNLTENIFRIKGYSLIPRFVLRYLKNKKYYFQYVRKDYKKALELADRIYFYSDSLALAKQNSQATDALLRFNADHSEREIQFLNQQKQLQRMGLYAIGGGLLAAVAFVGFLFYRNKAKQRINKLLADQNNEIKLKNQEIESAYEELNVTLEQVQAQKLTIEDKSRKIEDSILYAKRIQTAILPSDKYLNKAFQEFFIYYEPRDIVSGDFYWFTVHNDLTFFAVVDCTGHGVPGAFMSVVGFNLLNHIVIERNITEPSQILSELDKRVRTVLNQDTDIQNYESDSNDGMDVIILVWDQQRQEAHFAGAGRPLWILDQGELIEIKPDKYPVGGSQHENKEFHTHVIALTRPLTCYFFTDGITDQFGGEQNRKFTPKRLKEFILRNGNLPLAEQYASFTEEFNAWRKNKHQFDDLTFAGIRLHP